MNFKVSRHQDQAATFGLTRHTVADFNPSPLSRTGRSRPPVVSEKGGERGGPRKPDLIMGGAGLPLSRGVSKTSR